MRIDIVAVIPELLEGPLGHSIVGRARKKGLADIRIVSLRDFGLGKHKQLDDYPYGGGGGMVLRCEPLSACLDHLLAENSYDDVIYMSPDGATFDQPMANQMSMQNSLLLVCGHYKGMDQRIRDTYITKEISIGDFVISGGELAAAVVTDALVRLIPGVLGDEMSALSDSFQDQLLAPPVYTRPEEWRGQSVPEILRSGDEKKIAHWRYEQAVQRTQKLRPDLLKDKELPPTETI
jgi:tRNA (guanine37-N1)-methyltransferase